MNKRKKRILITGASSGLGLAILKELLSQDYFIIATARSASIKRFENLGFQESKKLLIRPLDITNCEEQKTLARQIYEKCGGIDVLINNAAISYRSVLEQMSSEEEEEQIKVNYLGGIELTKLFLPKMRQQQSGHIINISSVGGMMAMPTMASYSASKFALEGASEALWYELKPWNINVTLLQLGFIHSNSFQNVLYSKKGYLSEQDPNDDYHTYYTCMRPFIKKMMNKSLTTPEKIAKKIGRLIESKKTPLRVAGTTDALFFHLLRRLLPRQLYHKILYKNLPCIEKWGPHAKKN